MQQVIGILFLFIGFMYFHFARKSQSWDMKSYDTIKTVRRYKASILLLIFGLLIFFGNIPINTNTDSPNNREIINRIIGSIFLLIAGVYFFRNKKNGFEDEKKYGFLEIFEVHLTSIVLSIIGFIIFFELIPIGILFLQ